MKSLSGRFGRFVAYCASLKKPVSFWVSVISVICAFIICGAMILISIVFEISWLVGLGVFIMSVFFTVSLISTIIYFISQFSGYGD